MNVVLLVGQQRRENRVSGIGGSWWQTTVSFNVGDGRVVDLLDGVRGEAFLCAVPSTCTLQAELGVVDLVVDVLLEAVIAAVHPSDVGVALHVNADGRMERVSVVDGDAGVVHHNQVTVGTRAGVLSVIAALRRVARKTGREARVVVHLGVRIENRHVDLARIVG